VEYDAADTPSNSDLDDVMFGGRVRLRL